MLGFGILFIGMLIIFIGGLVLPFPKERKILTRKELKIPKDTYYLFRTDEHGQHKVVGIVEAEDTANALQQASQLGLPFHNIIVMKKVAVVNKYSPPRHGKVG